MSYLFNNQVDFVSRSLDTFSRLRVSSPLTLFEHNNQYGTTLLKWDTSTSGTGTISDSFVTSLTTLSNGGTASGASAVRQTRAYVRLLAGKSLIVSMTFSFSTGVTGVSKRVGYYDTSNGVFLEQNGTAINLVVRSNRTGTPTDVAIPQTSWSVDKLDGTGPSGVTLNPSANQNLRLDFIGVNAVRAYFHYNGQYYLVHVLENTNVSAPTVPMPATLNLTIRQEILNLSSVSSSTNMTVGNCNATGEGLSEPSPSYTFSVGRGASTKSVTTRVPILTIQAATAINSNRNYGWINPQEIGLYSDNAIFYEVVMNGTLTGASYSSVNSSSSLANQDTSATAITGGIVTSSGYLSGGAKISVSGFNDTPLDFPVVYSSLSNTQDTITLVCTSVGGSAVSVGGSFTWSEFY